MPRRPRVHYEGAIYHVFSRGNNKEGIFLSQHDYQYFLDSLSKLPRKYGIRIFAFCLMPNHFHLLLQVEAVQLSIVMRSLLTRYSRYFNKTHRRTGHVFEDRFKAIVCDKDEYFQELLRYIHQNPTKAGLCGRPEDWHWSSYGFYKKRARCSFLSQKYVLEQFESGSLDEFVKFVEGTPDPELVKAFTVDVLFPVIGVRDFKRKVPLKQEARRRKRRKSVPRLSIFQIAKRICDRESVPISQLSGRGRTREMSRLREKIVYSAMLHFEYPNSKIAEYLGVSPSAVTHAFDRFERRVKRDREIERRLFRVFR